MDSSAAEVQGMWFANLLFLGIAFYFFVRARSDKEASARYADYSIACGALAFFSPELPLRLNAMHQSVFFWIAPALRCGVGITGSILAIKAYSRRTVDKGTGALRPTIGLCLSLLLVLAGASVPAIRLLLKSNDTPWTFQAPDQSFSMTFPSNQWQQQQNAGKAIAEFSCRSTTPMRLLLFTTAISNGDDFSAYTQERHAFLDKLPGHADFAVRDQSGQTTGGDPCMYLTTQTTSSDGGMQCYFCMAIVWLKPRNLAVVMMSEGPLRMLSQTGRASEWASYEEQTRKIAESVR